MEKKLLLVDDNDRYAKLLKEFFEKKGYAVDRATSANEGLQRLQINGINHYSLILTDITMETQLAGLNFLKEARKLGYTGKIIIASTGFNYPVVLYLAPFFLSGLKVDYLLPKTSVLRHDFMFYPCKIFPSHRKEIEL